MEKRIVSKPVNRHISTVLDADTYNRYRDIGALFIGRTPAEILRLAVNVLHASMFPEKNTPILPEVKRENLPKVDFVSLRKFPDERQGRPFILTLPMSIARAVDLEADANDEKAQKVIRRALVFYFQNRKPTAS